MSETAEDLTYRNLFRQHVLDIAEKLESGKTKPSTAAEDLRSLCESDISEMDEADIEVDFDIPEEGSDAGALIALGAGAPAPSAKGDPLEDALSRVIRLRDRINGLRIVAKDPGETDLEAYRGHLRQLRDLLLTANLD